MSDKFESRWEERPATNYILLVKAAKRFFVVVLKEMEGYLLMVTAFMTNPWRAKRMIPSAATLGINPT